MFRCFLTSSVRKATREQGFGSKSQAEVILENVYKLEEMKAIFLEKGKDARKCSNRQNRGTHHFLCNSTEGPIVLRNCLEKSVPTVYTFGCSYTP